MKILSFAVLFSLFLASPLFSQTNIPDSLLNAGISLIDEGELDKAWDVLEKAYKEYPQHTVFRYEQALIRMIEERYEDAAEIMEEIIDTPDSYGRYYQMLGNSYDLSGDAAKAIKTYKKGLELYPESGELYLELGVMYGKEDDYDKAMQQWEGGLTADPGFPSNYFHAGRIFMMTEDRGWGHLYTEIFLNLEPGTDRSMAMRGLLWQSYNDAISLSEESGEDVEEQVKSDEGEIDVIKESSQSGSFEFFEEIAVEFDSEKEEMMFPYPFFFAKAASVASTPLIVAGAPLTVAKIHRFRSDFLEQWYADTVASEHFNIHLYDYQQRLKDAGLFETYNYYLFYCEETAEEVQAWFEENPEQIDRLVEWLGRNPYTQGRTHPFSRLDLPGMPLEEFDMKGGMEIELERE